MTDHLAAQQAASIQSVADQLASIHTQLGAISENLRLLREAVEKLVVDR